MPGLEPPPASILAGASLFLDFDGTLVDLAETPSGIKVDPGLPNLLSRIAERLGGRLALVSGRSLADLHHHLPLAALSCAGSHGAEIRFASGRAIPAARPPGIEAIREALEDFAGRNPGLLLETKPAGFALHFRGAPALADSAVRFVSGLARAHGCAVQRGKMVVELLPPDIGKDKAVEAFMEEPDFAGGSPVFVGDDLTDEQGFAAAIRRGGTAVLVGPERETQAAWRLPDVAAVARWLEAFAAGSAR